MKKIKTTLSVMILATMLFYGCSKTEDVIENNTPSSNSGVTITVSDAYGVLAAVTSVSYTTVSGITVPVTTNTATAAFPTSPGSSTFADAGSVTLNTKPLTKQSNNAYVYQNLMDPVTLPPVTWNVAGSSAVPAINYTYERPMPAYSGYNALPATITKSAGVTISLGSAVTGADSVYVIISGGNNSYVLKRVGGNAAQAVFSASDLSSIGSTTTGMIQVAPWNYKVEDFNDKDYYFVNETAYSKIGITIN